MENFGGKKKGRIHQFSVNNSTLELRNCQANNVVEFFFL